MKFTVQQQTLSKALSTVSKAVTTKTTIPILKGILINATANGKLTLSASDLDLSIEKTIPDMTVEREGTTVVSARLFSDIIRKLPNEEVLIEQTEDQTILIKTTLSEFTIVGLSPEEFPSIGETEESDAILFNKEIFKEMIKKTAFSASIDESKGIIVGVLIEIEDHAIHMVALDGFRMAVVREEMKNADNRKIIIAAKILNEIYKIISEIEGEEDLSILLSSKKAVILLENTKIVLRLLDGEFIKYKDILPKESICKVKVKRNELFDSMERASLLSKEGKNNLVKISTSEHFLTITSRSEEGTVREEVNAEREGEDLEIGFNSKYVLDVLKVVEEEELVMEMNSNIKPCLIKPTEGDRFEYLILPVRISVV